MNQVTLSNVPSMSVERLIGELTEMYGAVIEKGLPMHVLPSVMLWSAPGTGKSQAIRQIAKRLETRTGKRAVVTDVRLLLFNPIDLRGIPTANEDKTLAVWLRPQIFQMDPSPEVINLLFLDEITAAPQSVQAAAYQITLDHTVGEHKLPENCIVIAAGNRVTDRSVAFRMPRALANRLLHVELEASFPAWKHWAVLHGIHPKVVGFLSFRQSLLMGFDAENDDLAFPTPRTWELVSNLLHNVNDDADRIYPLVAGLVGSGAAVEFCTWTRVWQELPSVSDIFAGKPARVPTGTDALYALTSAMTAYARAHKDDMTQIAHSIVYADRLPPDFSALLLKDYMYIEENYKSRLMRIPAFVTWLRKRGGMLNGTV